MNPTPKNPSNRTTIAARAVPTRIVFVLVVVALLAVAANVWLAVELRALAARPPVCPEPPRSLPCAAVPMRLMYEDPDCANTLLRVMNVTNVYVLPVGSDVPALDDETASHMQTLCSAFANASLPLPAICQYMDTQLPTTVNPTAVDRHD